MTGHGMGYCMLATDYGKPGDTTGFAGIDGKPVKLTNKECPPARKATADASQKEVIKMPGGS